MTNESMKRSSVALVTMEIKCKLKLQRDTITYSQVKWSEVAQSCPTLRDPVDCSPPGFSVHGILQARILEWVAISFSRGSSWPRDQTQVSHIAGRHFNLWTTREAHSQEWLKLKQTNSFKNLTTPHNGEIGNYWDSDIAGRNANW